MDFTSWRRLQYLLGLNDTLDDNAINRRTYLSLVPAISKKVENYISLNLTSQSYTKYKDSLPETVEYFFDVWPIASITSVHSDVSGEYDGSQSAESDFFIGKTESSIVLQTAIRPAKRGLRFIFTGGLATHGTQSQYTLSSEGSTAIAVGNFVVGTDSQAVGYVIAKTGTAITIEVLYGVFQVGETINARTADDAANIANSTATLSARTVQSLAESYPDIVTACELELRYMHDHRSDFENETSTKGETTRADLAAAYDLLPAVKSLLDPYRMIEL